MEQRLRERGRGRVERKETVGGEENRKAEHRSLMGSAGWGSSTTHFFFSCQGERWKGIPYRGSEGVLRGATQNHTLRGTQGRTEPSRAPRWFINQNTSKRSKTPAEECTGPYQNEGKKVKNYHEREDLILTFTEDNSEIFILQCG